VRQLRPNPNSVIYFVALILAACEAVLCMTTETHLASQQRSGRRLLKALGSGLTRHLSAETLEPPPEDLLFLLAQADRKRTSPYPTQPQPGPTPTRDSRKT